MTGYYFTMYTTPDKQFFFTITDKMCGNVKRESASYSTQEEAETAAREIIAAYDKQDAEAEQYYNDHLRKDYE